LLFLAATGCRASEALSVRLCDINFETSPDPATLFIRGEFTKTGVSRTILLTDEVANQLQQWSNYKYRTRLTRRYDKEERKNKYRKYTPEVNKEALLFSTRYNAGASIAGLYADLVLSFEKTLKRLGGKFAEYEHTKKRMKITFHSFRRHVKSTVSNLGYEPYSELFFMGHNTVSTYYRVNKEERVKIFRKIEPSLTYLDMSFMETKHADTQTRLEIVEQRNRELTENIQKIMEMVQENPKLAHVKPEVLVKKKSK
jgi:integrase